jgi:hypothetical protein
VNESDPAKCPSLSNYRATRAGVADQIAPGPLTGGVSKVLYPIHGRMTVTFEAGDAWTVAVQASETASAKDGEGRGYDTAPPLVAYRTVGPGRMVIFSTHSTCFTLNPYHFMWDSGRFLTEGDGARLLQNIYAWLAEPSLGSGALGGFDPAEQKAIFDISPRLAENPLKEITRGPSGTPHPALIGAQSSLTGGANTVAEMCARAKELGYEGVVFTEDAEALTDEAWGELVEQCEKATDERFLAIAGVRFPGLETGNEGIAFNLRKPWSDIPWRDTSFTTYVRIGVNNGWQANLACLSSATCPMPIRNLGAVNSIPLYTHGGTVDPPPQPVGPDERKQPRPAYFPVQPHRTGEDDATQLFEETSAEGWRLSPLVYRETLSAPDIVPLDAGPVTQFYAPRWGSDFRRGRDSLMDTAVSSGPVIEQFQVTMPGPWEALYDRELSIAIKLRAERPLRQVSVYFRQRLIRRYYPDAREFETAVRYWSCESGSFWLRAEDDEGGRAWCRAVPAHLVSFHHFIGGDRMNGYWYPTQLTEPGPGATKVSGRWCKILGSLYPGWGWGDRVAMYGPSQQDHPLGLETGPPDGGVREIRIAPRFQTTTGEKFLRSAPVRRVVLNSCDCVIMQDRIEHLVEGVTGEDGRHRRRLVRDERIAETEAHLFGFRWRQAVMLLVGSRLTAAAKIELAETEGANPSLFEVRAGDVSEAYDYVRVVYEDGEELKTEGPALAPLRTEKAGYVTLSAHPFGTPAVFFRGGSVVSVTAASVPIINVGPDVGGPSIQASREIGGAYVFVLPRGLDHEATLADIADKFGFDGSPTWQVQMIRGKTEQHPYPVPLTPGGDDHAIVAEFAAADLPNPLGIAVDYMKERWDAAIVDLDERELTRHCAIFRGEAWLVLDLTCPRRVFIGHPVVADDPDVFITVCSLSAEGGEIIVHNPEPERRTVRLRTEPGLAELLTWEQTVKLDPGETRTLRIDP